MKKIRAIFLFLLLFFILIFAIVLILAKTLITPENIKNSLSYESTRYLGREITINEVNISYLRTIKLKGISLKPVSEEEELLTCEEIEFKHGLFPLLIKKLLIKEVRITNPVCSLKLINGKLKSPVKRKRRNTLKKPSLGLFFLPDAVNIENGKIFLNTGSEKICFENVVLSADDISVVFPFKASLSANLQGSSKKEINCEATITVPKKEVAGNIKIDRIPVKQISSLLEAQKIPLTDGLLSLDTNISYKDSGLKIQGSAALKDTSILLTVKDKTLKIKDADTDLIYKASYSLSEKKLVLENIQGSFLSQKFKGKGSVTVKPDSPFFDISITSDNFSLEQIFDRLDITPDSPAYGLRLSGDLGIKAHLKGKLGKTLSPTISINLKGNKIIYPPLANLQPELIGSFVLDNKNISVKTFTIRAIGSTFTFTGSIPDYNNWPLKTNLRVTTSKVDLAHLFNEDPGLSEPEALEDIGPFNFQKISLKGPLNLGNTYLYGMPLNKVTGKYVFENNIFSINNLTGEIGAGTFDLSAKIDLGVEGLDYYFHLKLKNAGLDSLSRLLSPAFRRYVQGSLSGSCALKGTGTSPVSLNDNLKADGAFYMKDGVIRNLVFKPPLSSFIKMNKLKTIPFHTGTLNIRLRDSILDIDSEVLSEYLEFYSEGNIYLDTSLDLEAKLKISEKLFKGGKALAKFLPKEAGLIALPVIIKGTLKEPDVSLPEDTLRFIMKESLPGLIRGMMGGDGDMETDSSFKEIMDIFQGSMKKQKPRKRSSEEYR